MKVKEVDRTANIAWSPAPQVPVYLAAGTAAQQLDATFSTSSSLEIYSLNLSESGHDMPCVASLPVDQRFHKVVWGASGMQDKSKPSGLIVGGADRGVISMYDAQKLMTGENALLFSQDKHTGPVAALDFNPFQHNLLASGGSESELYIWDVNKVGTPMTPGAKSQPMDDIRCVAWNRQVQHILSSCFATRCVVWDLRKNDPIIKVSDSTSRMRCKVVAWHPDVATQLCIASEDDHTPVIQVWDLRLASSPLKTLEGHQKGVLSLSWCQNDSDLLLSCGKDNRIIVWNPNSPQGEIVAELPTTNQWSFDVNWCPRNPAIIASASFDGHVSVYSLMGGQQQVQPSNRITESFGPGMDNVQQQASTQVTMQLKTPPKWLRKPCGASFGFGGKLISFENVSTTTTNQQGVAVTSKMPQVYLSRVITETELVERSEKLETSLESGNLSEFCANKSESLLSSKADVAKLWQFIGASLSPDSSREYLNLLGLDLDEVNNKLQKLLRPANEDKRVVNGVSSAMEELGLEEKSFDEFEMISQQKPEPQEKPIALDKSFRLDCGDSSGQVSLALLIGNIDLAVSLAVKQGQWADALIMAAQGGNELLYKTQTQYLQREERTSNNSYSPIMEAIVLNGWDRLVINSDLSSWQEVLAALVVYCPLDSRTALAGQLASRLFEGGEDYRSASLLASVVAANLDQVVKHWHQDTASPQHLQDLVEVVVVLRNALQTQGLTVGVQEGGDVAHSLARYGTLLASQGCLASALTYLGSSSATDPGLKDLKERLEKSLAGPPASSGGYGVGRASTGRASMGYSRPGMAAGGVTATHRRDSGMQERKMSADIYSQFNTGLPSQIGGHSVGSTQPPPAQLPYSGYAGGGVPAVSAASYQQPPAAPITFQPAPPAGLDYRSATPLGFPTGDTGGVGGPAPPPPTGSGGGAGQLSSSNPLMKRSRAVDPSISAPTGFQHYGAANPMAPAPVMSPTMGYGGEYMSGGAPTTGFMVPSDPVPSTPANYPAMFDPNAAVSSASSSAALPPSGPPAFQHVPDHAGPGYVPLTSSGPGWNDPPPFVARPNQAKSPTVTDSGFSQQPITTPLIGGAPEPQAAVLPVWGGFTPAPVPEPAMAPPAQVQLAPSQPPAPRELPPLPVEYKRIKDVLDNLKMKCLQAANHPQTRRKLDDVNTKLEILYNKLREDVLSPPTIQGLQTIVQCITQYDYQSCFQVISGLIAGGSFAELADFMPGVKILLQVAQQTGVYLEQQQ